MRLIIYPSFEERFNEFKTYPHTFLVYGKVYDNFQVVHLIDLVSTPDSQLIGYLRIGNSQEEEPYRTAKELDYPYLCFTIDSQSLEELSVNLHKKDETILNIDFEIEKLNLSRLFVRIDQKETPLHALRNKKVAIIGLGSGGSLLALYLAKSGVKNLIFIDDDQLETHNIIRHLCDLSQIGRYKTLAVKDFILARMPDIKIKTVERKFNLNTKNDFDFFMTLLKSVDLIAAVSGEHDVNYAINDFVQSNKLPIPVIFAGTFEGVKGGLMFKVDPRNNDFCYHCVYARPEIYGSIRTKAIPTTEELERKISYDRTMQEQLAQPGLGLDVDNLTILLAKFCLDILLVSTPHGLYHFPYNFYMWFNRTILNPNGEIKFDGMELYYYEDLEKDSHCPYHGSEVDQSAEVEKKE